jgi:hypothetical protein
VQARALLSHLVENIADVMLDRLSADFEILRNFLIGITRHDCGHNLKLTRCAFDLIRSYGGSHIAAGSRDVLDVALLVHRLTVFVGRKISRQIYWFAAKFAGYVWERVTTHNDTSFGRSQVA